jgi:hypothetical protein
MKTFALKAGGALCALAALAILGSLLAPGAAWAGCVKTAAASSTKAATDTAGTWTNTSPVCQNDAYQTILNNSKGKEKDVTYHVQNNGECNLEIGTSTSRDSFVEGNQQEIPPGAKEDVAITVPAGQYVVATCDGGPDKKCSWTITRVATVAMTAPADGAAYKLGKTVKARYRCLDAVSCVGTVPNGAPIDTSTPGPHTFSVVAGSSLGFVTRRTVTYRVVPRTAGAVHGVSPATS